MKISLRAPAPNPIHTQDEQYSELQTTSSSEIQSVCLAMNIRKASRALTRHYDDFLRISGLSVTDFALLVTSDAHGATTISKLARELIMDRTTAARNLKRLDDAGLVRIEVGDDRRKRLVSLTTQGVEALAAARPHWHRAQASVVQLLGDDRWAELLGRLTAVTQQRV